MKTRNILLPSYNRKMNPYKRKLSIMIPIKEVAKEIGIVTLLKVIALVSVVVGLIAFLGFELM